jgi:sugar phosphate isomerase/epimerase
MTSTPDRGYRFAASAFTTFPSTYEQDLEDYVAVGLDGIGLWEAKLPANVDDARALDLFRASGLAATFCFPDVPSPLPGDTLFAQPRDPAERIERMCAGIRRLAAFEPLAVACYAGPPGAMPEGEARRWVVESLTRGAQAADESGTRLALEVLRPSPGGSLASTVEAALELIDDSGASNIDVFVDVWHAWDPELFITELARYAHRIIGVQVCDRPAAPRSWMDRRIPGTADSPLPDILNSLRAGGFDGWFELEIFSDDGRFGNDYPDSLWKRPPRELLAESLAAFDRLWRAAA